MQLIVTRHGIYWQKPPRDPGFAGPGFVRLWNIGIRTLGPAFESRNSGASVRYCDN